MGLKEVLLFVLVIVLIALTAIYLIPFNTVNFSSKPSNYNFSVISGSVSEQFYPNMRFPSSAISYRISNCPLQKTDDMKYAFGIVEQMTILSFYPVESNEEISVTCQDIDIVKNGMFTAGEGGPTNITVSGEFNVISRGYILLIKESNCQRPNIALHELFHVLGFGHSSNPENIMYNFSSCDQTIGEDMIQTINTLYAVPSLPDLKFGDVSAVMSGRFLNINVTVINEGLVDAGSSTVVIYADGKVLKEISIESLEVGQGIITMIQNLFVSQFNVKKLELVINDNFYEISKDNNRMELEIK